MRIEKTHLLGGKYRLLQLIKSGRQSRVWTARSYDLGIDVAVKILRADLLQQKMSLLRFKREIDIVSALKHKYICEILDSGQEDDIYYFVMPMLLGMTLFDFQKVSALPMSRVVEIVSQVLCALEAAHNLRIIHRDVKPSNIFVTRLIPGKSDGNIRLLDFGVSKLMDDTAKLTDTGISLGTIHYMSPEQLYARRIDHRADLYSVGAVLYEALTGKKPHAADTPESVQRRIERSVPFATPRSVNPRISRPLETVILKAMSRAPDDRYKSAAEMNRALLEAASAPEAVFRDSPTTKETLEFIPLPKSLLRLRSGRNED